MVCTGGTTAVTISRADQETVVYDMERFMLLVFFKVAPSGCMLY